MKTVLPTALSAVPFARQCVAGELRAMAEGTDRYARFSRIDPWVRNVWAAAAELLEGDDARETEF